ncbi:MAG: hypothetical protein CBD76_00265 [Pelagibacteraceae bacterium TMED216]|nr:MAG: hypothetical protein CBD76_00265 [Pelagibacteraceae bacterium TMED216]|tara:strand:+ start:3938 stop:4798 length:861 start_codon:yes stop_codon:yes gene_type:complete
MMQKLFQYTKILISLYFIYFFIDYTIENQDNLKYVFKDSIQFLFIIIFLKILIILLNSLIFKKIVQILGIKINFPKANELTILNYLGNLVGPMKLGAGMRIEYLRQNYDMSIKNFVIKNFSFTAYTQLIYISIFIFALYIDKKISITYLIILLLIMFLNLFLLNKNTIFEKDNILNIKDFLYSSIFNVSILALFFIGVSIVILEVNLVLGYSYHFLKGIYIFEGISLTNIVNLTPANLGIREFSLLFINSLHQLNLDSLIEIGIIDRFCSLASTFTLFLIQKIKKI